MLKRLLATLIVFALLTPLSARASGDPVCRGLGQSGYGCNDNNGSGKPGGGGGPAQGYWYVYVDYTQGPSGCWGVWFRPAADFVATPTTWTEQQAYQVAQQDYAANGIPQCNSAAAVALQIWADQKPVPAQHPSLQPDDTAVTGKRSYLLMNGAQRLQTTFPNPLGPSPTITAHVVYDIDWGDGTTHTITANPGVAWPGGPGEITHVYDVKGVKTITVRATWTGTWTDPNGAGGNLPALTVPYTFNVTVGEIQAVRNR